MLGEGTIVSINYDLVGIQLRNKQKCEILVW